jgi:diaminopimelate epimerase
MDDAMTLRFTKMHGLGNDFMVLNLLDQHLTLDPDRIRAWSDRHTGVGFDQLLLLQRATQPDCDFAYRIYNADGDPVEHCGNGARCITRFAIDKRLTSKRQLVFQMARGSIETRLEPDGQVTVDMRPPLLAPAEIPFLASAQALTYPLEIAGRTCTISAVSMGNPHAVLLVDDVEGFPVAELGPALEQHAAFPRRVNAGFLQILDRSAVRLRVYERGVGETLSCGTGACAAMVAGRLRGLLDDEVTVQTRGGDLRIQWTGPGASVWMTGPAVTVFEGELAV